MKTLNIISKYYNYKKLKRILFIFLLFFSFLSAVGIFYSIYNTADSDAKTVWAFLLLGLISFLSLITAISVEIFKLLVDIKKKKAGSKLQTKIIAVFATIAIIPVFIVAIFAVIFFEKGIEGWFSKRVGTALEKSSAIAENYSLETKKKIEGDALFVSLKLSNFIGINIKNRLQLNYFLDALALERQANELAIISSNGSILASSKNSYFLPSDLSPIEIFSSEKNKNAPIVFIESSNDRITVLTPIVGHIGMYLYLTRYLDPVIIYNIKSVEEAFNDYSRAKKASEESRITFTMVFLSVAILLLLLAVLIGIAFANSITSPISLLIDASEKISKGNLKFKISEEKYSNNEIFKLITSFNEMIKQLYDQRKDLVTANEQIDNRRRFTESILTGVKSGVIGVASDSSIFLINKSGLELLEADASKLIGTNIYQVFPILKDFIADIKTSKVKFKEKQVDYFFKGRKKTFILGISLENKLNLESGYVVTIEDITELIKIQRSSAWEDIAKRIAHEIKNPLTPIQLSADRLKHKYQNKIKDDKDVFNNCIDTIIRQVSTMHRMVNEFSTFAKMPRPIFQVVNICDIVRGNVSMTRLANKDILIKSNLMNNKKIILKADPNLINQAFNNLIKNSITAIKENNSTSFEHSEKNKGKITVTLSTTKNFCYLTVSDNGRGLPANKEYLTEPYISRSKKGSGIGLAVVKKIMQDHKGEIELNNNDNGVGANVRLLFPIEIN